VELYEILVPTMMNGHPVRTKHHKEWDKYVRGLSNGLTILKPAKGQWIDEVTDVLHEERMIPVRVGCTRLQLYKIVEFTLSHYNQIAVMAYKISDDVIIRRR
jgi:hypothetical protein